MSQLIGVCSWSLQPASLDDLVVKLRATGLDAVQLALDPLGQPEWPIDETVSTLARAGIRVVSGMMRTKAEDYSTLESIRRTGGLRPDEHWDTNQSNATRIADLARRIGVDLVTFHAGFLPESAADPLRSIMIGRLRRIIDIFGARGVRVGFETGQETAETLASVLADLDRPTAGVNFDPANMILYDHGDPVESLRKLAPRVCQIHIKDATRTTTPGAWGRETAVGAGDVNWQAFVRVLKEANLGCDLIIEREAGSRRIDEIRSAARLVRAMIAGE